MHVRTVFRYSIIALAIAGIAVGATQMVTAGGADPEPPDRVRDRLAAELAGPDPTAPGGIKGEIRSIVGKAPIEGAAVTVESPGGGRRTITGASGEFEFVDLPAGAYVMDVSAPGYQPRANLSVTVINGATSPIDVHMRLGDDGPAAAETPGPGAGPYLVLPVSAHETTAGSLQEVLNQADTEGYELVSLLPATGLSDTPAHHLLILRRKD